MRVNRPQRSGAAGTILTTMNENIIWTEEDEANYFRQAYLDLKRQQDSNKSVLLLLEDFIAEHYNMLPAIDLHKLMEDIWRIRTKDMPSI